MQSNLPGNTMSFILSQLTKLQGLGGAVLFSSFWLCLVSGSIAELDRPNILLAIADDWSFGQAGAYGCRWVRSPGFDRVAREGILFTRAYTPNAKCAPSRACLLTGRNSWQLKEACNHICNFPPEFTTYAEALSQNGYSVGVTGKGWGPGIAKDVSGKPRQMAGQPFNRRKQNPPARAMSNNNYSANFQDFLTTVPKDQPWCFWFGTTEPHRGFEPGAGTAKTGKQLSDVDRVPKFWPDTNVVRQDMLDYAFEVEHFDRHLVRILNEIESRGQLDNTLVIVTSDHGMPFPRCKGQAYDYSNHVPLAVMWGSRIKTPGRVLHDYISFVDLAPTMVEVAGLDWSAAGMQPTAGRSLTDLFDSPQSGQVDSARDHVLIGKERHDIGRPGDVGYPIRGIVMDNFIYLQNYEVDRWPAGNPETGYLNCDGGPTKTIVLDAYDDPKQARFWSLCFGKRPPFEMYDVDADPDCIVNLADDPDYADRRNQLAEKLERRLREQRDPRILGNGEVFERYQYTSAGTRDFYRRFMQGEKVRAGWVNRSDFRQHQSR